MIPSYRVKYGTDASRCMAPDRTLLEITNNIDVYYTVEGHGWDRGCTLIMKHKVWHTLYFLSFAFRFFLTNFQFLFEIAVPYPLFGSALPTYRTRSPQSHLLDRDQRRGHGKPTEYVLEGTWVLWIAAMQLNGSGMWIRTVWIADLARTLIYKFFFSFFWFSSVGILRLLSNRSLILWENHVSFNFVYIGKYLLRTFSHYRA